jgi:hypothetical protein
MTGISLHRAMASDFSVVWQLDFAITGMYISQPKCRMIKYTPERHEDFRIVSNK